MSGGSHNRGKRRPPPEQTKPNAPTSCPHCRKKSYPTRRDARHVLRTLYPGDRGLSMHAYRCGEGGDGWHIGHRPRRLRSRTNESDPP